MNVIPFFISAGLFFGASLSFAQEISTSVKSNLSIDEKAEYSIEKLNHLLNLKDQEAKKSLMDQVAHFLQDGNDGMVDLNAGIFCQVGGDQLYVTTHRCKINQLLTLCYLGDKADALLLLKIASKERNILGSTKEYLYKPRFDLNADLVATYIDDSVGLNIEIPIDKCLM